MSYEYRHYTNTNEYIDYITNILLEILHYNLKYKIIIWINS